LIDHQRQRLRRRPIAALLRQQGSLATPQASVQAVSHTRSSAKPFRLPSSTDWRPICGTKFSYAGVALWTDRYNGGFDDLDNAIARDRNGNVFVAGYSWNGTNQEWVTIKYASSVPPSRVDFQKLNNQLVLSWTNAGFNLQSAPAVTGTFTNISGATSPYTNALTSPQQFFRLISN
jgi:hypothetical protein